MIDTVVFDLGKVLVDFHPQKAMEELGFFADAIQAMNKGIFSGLWEACDEHPISNEDIRKLFKKHVPGFEKEVDLLWDNITKVTGVYDYSYEWLESLKKRGLKIYILSNFGEQAFKINSQLYDFLELTDGRVVSYDVSLVKPDPQIYDCLCKKYSIDPTKAVFIDDRQVNIDGAIKYGMQGILFTDYKTVSKKLDEIIG